MEEASTAMRSVWKRTSALLIAALCLLSVAPLAIPVAASPAVTLSVCDKADLPGTVDTTIVDDYLTPGPPGPNFTASIYIQGVTDLYMYEIDLRWNATVLRCNAFRTGDFFPIRGIPYTGVDGDTDWTDGEIYPPWARTSTGSGGNGNGTLFEADFTVLIGNVTGCSTWINVTYRLENSFGGPITPDTIQDGWFQVTKLPPPPARRPVISETENPVSGAGLGTGNYWVMDNVTCTGLTTTTAFNNITELYGSCTLWNWTVTWPNGTVNFNGLVGNQINVTLWIEGTWTITVVGYAPVMDPEWPGLAWSLPVTVTKKVWAPVAGWALDLYTETLRWCGYNTTKIGAGPSQPCDAYNPGEKVQLYANLTWNGDGTGQANYLVAWEVYRPKWVNATQQMVNDTLVTGISWTNATGTANFTFRIPTATMDNATAFFGKWWVIAKVKVPDCWAGESKIINDTMGFDVGWLVQIVNMTLKFQPYKKTVEYGGTGNQTIWYYLKNIAQYTRNFTATVQFYDACMFPVLDKTGTGSIAGGDFCIPKEMVFKIAKVKIPARALIGAGKVTAAGVEPPKAVLNVFTALPWDCGVAYCPPLEVPIEIVPPPPGWTPD